MPEQPSLSPTAGPLGRLYHGFTLPLHTARLLLRDPSAKKAYFKQVIPRVFITFAITLLLGFGQLKLLSALAGEKNILTLEGANRLFAAGASLYGTLCIVEWCMIALTREYDDQISRRASLALGLEPEDPEANPKVRINLKWLKKKIQRRIRGYRVYFLALPLLAPLLVIPLPGNSLYSTLLTLWTLYWSIVFTAAKCGASWKDEQNAPDPWYITAYIQLTQRLGNPRLMQGYGRWWKKHSQDMFSPCKAVSDHPWSMAGLALFRALCDFPGIYLFARPFLPVAAAYIIESKQAAPAQLQAPNTETAPIPHADEITQETIEKNT